VVTSGDDDRIADGVVVDLDATDLEVGAGADLEHLHPSMRPIARLPAEERLRHVQADRWIGYPRATAALERLETLYGWPARQRMPNLLVIGPTNNGKSMIVEKFRRAHPPVSRPDGEQIPVLVVQMPSDPSVSRFYTALLAAIGAPLQPRQRLAEREQLALRLLRAVGVRVLVIDELHNVLAGRGEARREFLNLIRFLGNELRIPLVGVGTREAYLAIRSDDQLENRFEPVPLPRWEPDEQACSLLASFAAALPLRRPSHIATESMARYLLTRSEGTIGELVHLLTDAAVAAIESGQEAINQRTLLMADYTGPSQRRRLFERELT
jgi:type II secretory pathway predicted ATPase ExeA